MIRERGFLCFVHVLYTRQPKVESPGARTARYPRSRVEPVGEAVAYNLAFRFRALGACERDRERDNDSDRKGGSDDGGGESIGEERHLSVDEFEHFVGLREIGTNASGDGNRVGDF